jgi:hypothetical protein
MLIENEGTKIILKRPGQDRYEMTLAEATQLVSGTEIHIALQRARAAGVDEKQKRINELRAELTQLVNN